MIIKKINIFCIINKLKKNLCVRRFKNFSNFMPQSDTRPSFYQSDEFFRSFSTSIVNSCFIFCATSILYTSVIISVFYLYIWSFCKSSVCNCFVFLHLNCHEFSLNKLSAKNYKFQNHQVRVSHIYHGPALKSKSLGNHNMASILETITKVENFGFFFSNFQHFFKLYKYKKRIFRIFSI